MMATVNEQASVTGVAPLCRALGLARASVYRAWRRARFPAEPTPRSKPGRALGPDERQAVLDVLHAPRFADKKTNR